MSSKPTDAPDYPVRKSDAEWRQSLDRVQYAVTRECATERAFTGKYWDHFEPGQYLCVGCGTCVAVCPSKSTDLDGFTEQQIYAMVESLS